MAENSKIEWTKHTVNLWMGCTHVHAGCDHCYAESMAKHYGHDIWGVDKPRLLVKNAFPNLAKFQRLAFEANEVHRVFVGSLMDIFEKSIPLLNPIDHFETTGDLRQEFFTRINTGLYPNLYLLLLTKRPSNISKYIPAGWLEEPPSNIMYGTSVSVQGNEMLVDQLLKVKGNHFISVEPQIGPIKLKKHWFQGENKINWVIQGGESGHHKRPFDLQWARDMHNQCIEFGVPYFFKQIDKIQQIPEDLQIRQFSTTHSC